MRKTAVLSAFFLYVSTLILTVNAQTTEPSNASSQGGATLIGQVLAVVGIVVVFAVIAYAGYKVVRKWSRSQPD
jgi:Tfp pilus assembly protein PilE